MKLSICMMIKDEEKNLVRCLNSLIPLMEKVESELIVIDTGSTDKSPEIAKKYTDKLFFHPWNNNFSEMRNISISYAKGDWILIIDADEELVKYEEIVEFLNSQETKKYNTATVLCKNIMTEQDYNSIFITSFRLFKNNGLFKYYGSVHNKPHITLPTKNLNDLLYHYGYITMDKELVEKKFKRTSSLLLNELEKNPDDLYYRYQLAASYFSHEDYDKALAEIEKTYNCLKEKELPLRENIYIFPLYAKSLYQNNFYEKAREICEEGIKVENQHIDLYCYLGEILYQLKEYDASLNAFDRYLFLVNNYNKLEVKNDTMMYFEKLNFVENVYFYHVHIYYNKKKYENVIKYISLVKDKLIVEVSIPYFVESILRLYKFDVLKDYYENIINKYEDLQEYFINFVEKLIAEINYDGLLNLYKCFSNSNSSYGILNKFRVAIVEKEKFDFHDLNNYMLQLNLNNLPEYYGDILYYFINNNIDIYNYLSDVKEADIIKYLVYIQKKNSNFTMNLNSYLNSFINENNFQYVRVNKVIAKVMLASAEFNDEEYYKIFLDYVGLGIKHIDFIYNNNFIKSEWIVDSRNNEDTFIVYMKKGLECQNNDKINFVKYLKRALRVFPEMNKGVNLILNQVMESENEKQNIVNKEINSLGEKIKENIELLINNGELENAKNLLSEYEKIATNDVDIYSIRSIICINEQNYDEAEKVLLSGLRMKCNNKDLLFNLAYVYECEQNIEKAIECYRKAFYNSDDESFNENIKNIVINLIDMYNLDIKVDEIFAGHLRSSKKVLQMCHFYSVYMKEFISHIYDNYDALIEVMTIDGSYKNNLPSRLLNNIYTYDNLNKLSELLKRGEKYEIIHVHFLSPFYGDVADQIRDACNKLIITIWGSDFYRTSKEEKEQQRKLIEKADFITFDNEVTMDDFSKYYTITNKEKLSINRFGLTALEYIKDIQNVGVNQTKIEYGIPKDSIVVTCGYNANPAHNHLEIIRAIKKVKIKLPSNMYYIFPMTYSRDEDYCKIVQKELMNSGLRYMILEKFMDFEQIAKLTKITDIMVQLQTTDTLSATMQENMYNGNVIITGSWLPYKPLKDIGAYFLEVSTVNKIGHKLIDVVSNLNIIKQRCIKNKDIIWNFSAWENTINKWKAIYNFEFSIPQQLQPMVTVGIINYNYSRYIDNCINSVLQQDYHNIDILIIDDCSSKDDSKQKISEYVSKNENIRAIYHDVNKGLTSGLRDVIQYANGRYFIFLSADDFLYRNDSITQFVKELERDSNVNYVHCNLVNVDADRNYKNEWKYKQYTKDEMIYNTFMNCGIGIVPSTAGMYRTSFFKTNNITWYENIEQGIVGDDTLNSLYFEKYNWNYKYIDKGLIAYRQHDNNLSFNFLTRIKCLISSMEFLVMNFDERIYIPTIEWNKLSYNKKMAVKMFKLGEKYWHMFLIHYKNMVKPWEEIKFDLSENYNAYELIGKYIKSYFNKSMEYSNLFADNIKSILNELEATLSNIHKA